jgi:signal transduction histidine kinase
VEPSLAITSERLRALVDAGIALTSELSLDALLEKLVDGARELTGARYAALGVIGRTGRELERFVTSGIDEETRRQIGEPPRGRGILGALITEQRVLRLHDLTEDPRAVGFPPNHPPMHSFLGVPILLRGVAYGNLYLTEKEGDQDFTDDDEELVKLLAAQAAVAIENARLYESATRWLEQLESLSEVSNALVSELEPSRLLDLVAQRLRELLGARRVFVALTLPDGRLRVDVAAGEDAQQLVGAELAASSKPAKVLARRRSERVDSLLDDPEIDPAFARTAAGRSALFVPLFVRDRPIGVLVANDRSDVGVFSEDDLRLTETFAARAAIAVDQSERVSRDALRRVVEAQELERRRLARELHDETGQALTSMLLSLRAVEDAQTPEETHEAAALLREQLLATLQDVRRLAVELRPKALDDFGLVPAVERLASTVAERTGIDIEVEARLGGERLSPESESALYRIVQEALTNVVKHAQAQKVSVVLIRKQSTVAAVIEDDGRGFLNDDRSSDGLGLLGMEERLALIDGRLTVESAEGRGTTIVAEVPA